MVGVGVLEADLVPVACRPGDIGRISEGLVTVVQGALHPIEEEAGAPLPVPLVGDVRIHAERADVASELISAGSWRGQGRIKAAIGIIEITATAVEYLSTPIQPLELIIPKRNVAHFEVEARDAAFVFGEWNSVRPHEGVNAAAIVSPGIDQSRDARFQLDVGRQIEVGREPSEIVEAA